MSDRGHAAVELAMAVAVLLLPVALVVTAFGPWSERRVTVEATTAEAARAVAVTLDHQAGVDVVASVMTDHGFDESEVRLAWCGGSLSRPTTASWDCPLTRGTSVLIEFQVWTPLIATPWGGIGGLWVIAEHVEPIDLYRSLG